MPALRDPLRMVRVSGAGPSKYSRPEILGKMTVVLTNDDGLEAPGLAALQKACSEWCTVAVVAPDRCHSSMSHHVNTMVPLEVAEVEPRRYRVAASPADCARLARTALYPDAEWLFSGINRGANLGMDACYSGTIAAAREATLLGMRAIAISHYIARGSEVDWHLASARITRVLRQLVAEPLGAGEFWNVNLPHLPASCAEPDLAFCALDPSPLPVLYRQEGTAYRYIGDYQRRERLPGHDVTCCFDGAITATRISARNGF